MEVPRGVVLESIASGDGVVMPIAVAELPAGVGVVIAAAAASRGTLLVEMPLRCGGDFS